MGAFQLEPASGAAFVGPRSPNELSSFETVSALIGALLTGVFLIGLLERRNPTVMKIGWTRGP